jgi:hypothetical protein
MIYKTSIGIAARFSQLCDICEIWRHVYDKHLKKGIALSEELSNPSAKNVSDKLKELETWSTETATAIANDCKKVSDFSTMLPLAEYGA